jgi:hypothetical protein
MKFVMVNIERCIKKFALGYDETSVNFLTLNLLLPFAR